MIKRILIFAGILLVIILGALIWLVLHTSQPEPTYQGKSLSYWIGRLNFMTQDLKEEDLGPAYWEGEQPVLEIGPPAIPFLIKTLQKKDSRLNDAYVALWPRLPKRLQSHLFMPQKAATMRDNAARGLKLFGPMAVVAVPNLIVALQDKDPWVRSAAANALGAVGPGAKAAVPLLIQGLNDPDKNMRLACLIGLNGAGQDSSEVVPVLQRLLKDNDGNTRSWAVMSLGKMNVEREPILEALKEALQDEATPVRLHAAEALGQFGPRAASAVPMLLGRLELETKLTNNSASLVVIWKILEALEKIGPKARAAIPALTNRLNSNISLVSVYSARALWAIQPHNPFTIPNLTENLKDEKKGNQYWAIRTLGRIGPDANDAWLLVEAFTRDKDLQAQMEAVVAAWKIRPTGPPPLDLLVKTYHSKKHGTIRRNAIELLGELGPAAREAIPTIMEATKDRETLTREFAWDALKKVRNE